MDVGQFLRFIPPKYADDDTDTKKRYMLILDVNEEYVKLVNVSKLEGKPRTYLYKCNVVIRDYEPLPLPSFTKINSTYILEKFDELKKFIAFDGKYLAEWEIENIKLKMENFYTAKVVYFTKQMFWDKNSIIHRVL